LKQDYSLDRGMPHCVEAERTVLGAIVLDTRKPNECLLQAQQRLTTNDFSLDSHRRIFNRMGELQEADKPIDYVTLTAILQERGELEAVGGTGYVTSLGEGAIRLKNVEYYIELILKAASQREIIHRATSAIQKAYELGDPEDIAGELTEGLQSLSERSQSESLQHVSKIIPGVAQELIEEFNRGGSILGLPTGIGRLNYTLGGLVKGENVIVAADPGGGKTALALNIAEVNCERDTPVAYFSLELTKKKLLIRLAARRSGVPQFKVRNPGYLSNEEKLELLKALDDLKHLPLWIDDSSGLTPRQIYARGRMAAARGAKLLITDYLQKLRAPGSTLREQTNNASEVLRAMAKDSHTAGLNLSQLSRPAEKGFKGLQRKATMHDLRESGAIEADADSVVLLWRERKESDGGKWEYTGQDVMIIGKNRNGPETELPVTFDAVFMHWKERDTGDLPADGMYDRKQEAAGAQ